jgi:hypothetical protein
VYRRWFRKPNIREIKYRESSAILKFRDETRASTLPIVMGCINKIKKYRSSTISPKPQQVADGVLYKAIPLSALTKIGTSLAEYSPQVARDVHIVLHEIVIF